LQIRLHEYHKAFGKENFLKHSLEYWEQDGKNRQFWPNKGEMKI
jgi:hypothetical protein